MVMPAQVNFATFVAAFMAPLEYGMEGAQAVGTNTGCVPCGRSSKSCKGWRKFGLRRHFITLLEHSAEVRELLLTAMISGLKDGMTALATQGSVLHRKHSLAAPASGTGRPMTTKSFTLPRELVDEGAGTSLVQCMEFWRQASVKTAGLSGVKRKGAPGAGGQRTAHPKGQVGTGRGAPC